MKRNGFTLIELLAVIIILVIIIVIAVSKINSTINKTSDSALKANAASVIKAVNDAASNVNIMQSSSLESGTILYENFSSFGIELSGTKPDFGYVVMNNYEVTSACFKYDEYTIEYENGEYSNPSKKPCSAPSLKFDFAYTGTEQTYNVSLKGKYKLEVWGAQGGGSQNADAAGLDIGVGGKGGYSSGIITLNTNDVLYIYVGGTGRSTDSGIALGGFNGGGSSFATSAKEPAAGGGGATDIRINGNTLYSRIIVAGGGGGGGEDASDTGKYAGGVTGGGNYGGTQSSSSGGGTFGLGANTTYDGGAGGGGWYGGGTQGGSQDVPTSNSTSDTNSNASGGSGFVYTNSSSIPNGYLPINKYRLSSTQILSGNNLMPNHSSSDNMTGNSGNGYARITLVEIIN